MATSRDKILNKLRAARAPFPDAPPRPKAYRPVTRLDDESPEALLERFTEELVRLNGEVFPVKGQAAARKKVLELLAAREAQSVLAWDFAHIPVEGLEAALQKAGISVLVPDLSDDRAGRLQEYEPVPVGLTGADGAIAATGSLVVSVAPGKGRIPTVLPRLHLAVITLDQIVPRLEDWVAQQRAAQFDSIRQSSNLAFITGPSRTADIEKNLVLGMHGPEQVQVIVRR
ncbi:MAG: LUD domain-containing protein [Anaerolineae bacterium]|nr:LUD domain-containing protein [Anaerolineae bacterium]